MEQQRVSKLKEEAKGEPEEKATYNELVKEKEILQRTVAGLEKEMAELEASMIEQLNAANATSINTKSATILRRVTKRYNPSNWDSVYKLVDKYKAYGLLHKRIHDANMATFLEEHPGEYPEGLNLDSRYAVTVKRKSGE